MSDDVEYVELQFAYDPPIPLDRPCTHCGRPMVVIGYEHTPIVVNGERNWLFAHADDLATRCTRTTTNRVRPYDGWGIGKQVYAEQRRRLDAEDETDVPAPAAEPAGDARGRRDFDTQPETGQEYVEFVDAPPDDDPPSDIPVPSAVPDSGETDERVEVLCGTCFRCGGPREAGSPICERCAAPASPVSAPPQDGEPEETT